MQEFLMVGGPFNGKRVALPEDMTEHFVADIGAGIRHRYVKTEVPSTAGGEVVFLHESLKDGIDNAVDAVAAARAIKRA